MPLSVYHPRPTHGKQGKRGANHSLAVRRPEAIARPERRYPGANHSLAVRWTEANARPERRYPDANHPLAMRWTEAGDGHADRNGLDRAGNGFYNRNRTADHSNISLKGGVVPMLLTFLGAAHEVTGSCTYIEAAGKRMLVDYGMEQGKDVFENEPLPVSPAEIDYVLVTHAHIDHSGRIPLLYKQGFTGEIHATIPTARLCDIMLRDSAHIQESDAEWKSRKNKRRGEPPVEPLYTMADAVGAMELFHGHPYNERVRIAEGIEARFTDAGHLLGSASIELWLTENGETRKLVFSGDVGNINQPLLRDPQFVDGADYAILESTYGDRQHNPPPDYASALAEVLQRTFDRGGSVVIPSFAVGRTQEMLYFIRHIKEEGLVHGHDGFTVYVDSPLAINATKIFVDNAEFCYDEEASALLRAGVNPIAFEGLVTASTVEESMAINADTRPKVILSASGMCEGGRIRHHLKHNLWNPANVILFVGYQAVGTLGRTLIDGADEVKLFGEDIAVRAEILQLPGVSGHGDVDELIRWITHLSPAPKQVFVNHGEDAVCEGFAGRLRSEFGLEATAPYSGTAYDLLANAVVTEGRPAPIRRAEKAEAPKPERRPLHAKLMLAAKRLYDLLAKSEGRTNYDVERMTRRLNDLCKEWEKE